MADCNFNQVAEDESLYFGVAASLPVYQLRPGVDEDDVFNELDAKLSQLRAILMQTYGGSGESFRSYNPLIQDNYMWACANLAEECQFLNERLWELRRNSATKTET